MSRNMPRKNRFEGCPVLLNGKNIVVLASIGMTFCHDCFDVDKLLMAADAAMYEAKKQGGDCFVISRQPSFADEPF
jgi:PleD family two-component response regulator